MEFTFIKKLSLFILFALFSFFADSILVYEKNKKINEYLKEKTAQYIQNYNALYHQQQGRSDLIYKFKINQPEVKRILKKALNSSEKIKSDARRELLHYLEPMYLYLKTKFLIKQLHFHTPTNRSFLRFHRPKVFGDDLTNIRTTVKYVNEKKLPIGGFEEGRIYNGYRFVYPLYDDTTYLGSVEVSFSTLAFNLDFMQHYQVISNFFILKEVMKAKVFEDEKQNYQDSIIKNFVIEKKMFYQIEKKMYVDLYQKLSQKTYDVINKRARDVNSFSIYDSKIKKVLTYIKVQNPVSKEVVGLFVVRSNANYIFSKIKNFYFSIFFVNVFILLILFTLYKEMKYREKIEKINQNLEQIIKEKIKEKTLLLSLFDKGDTVLFKWKNDFMRSVENVSMSVYTLCGYSNNDFLNNKVSYRNLIHEDDAQRVEEEVYNAMLYNDEFFKHTPYRIISKEGEIKWVLDYTIIVKDEEGNINNFIGAISDITELKRQESLLIQQLKLAQMGELISMIAHQWRQPLGAISSVLIDIKIKSQLQYVALDTEKKVEEYKKFIDDYVEKIDEYIQNLSTTIDDFRTFYKPNKERDFVQITEPIDKALMIIKSSLNSDGIEIVEKDSDLDAKTHIYSNELMQVILNILKNAQDNFHENDVLNPTIIISHDFDISKQIFYIQICDNGGGIDNQYIEKIFDPYFSTKNKKNGTGLGLYMSKIIVEKHHKGEMHAVNIDDGACFTLEIPLLN